MLSFWRLLFPGGSGAITDARWSPEGAEDILKIRAVVVNGDNICATTSNATETSNHLSRYDPATIEELNLAA